MADLRWDLPETEEVELTEEDVVEIEKAIDDLENGRWYTSEEVRQMIPKWISEFATQKPR